ncbi:hypothetical protein [Agarilytica rhodophyticola]|uniref:hypothetical protein n=1 Tax=Agarilytica rhodophyticola TaxID=1737490 RepID=UPI000B348FFC|nr:hypothetical protein [Agarilytica rhodophyticola]
MFSVLKSRLKRQPNHHTDVQEEQTYERPVIATETVDEEVLKQRIANKLQNYRPEERDANFTGIKYYKDV